jgi:hypothetical protein
MLKYGQEYVEKGIGYYEKLSSGQSYEESKQKSK